ncbi:uncharacterized protein LOC131614986 [Vicia villosa]|uniref:uncharacterized protein LOC131614986 n=1 Tax=Vicia villosa TaxID=3911 RepID=UPI00273C3D3B|nr:uncharacterized protein LOC131614986 [Vicia villosa]
MDGEENSFHLFIQCSKSIECWIRVGLWPLLQRISSNGELFASVIFSFLQVSNHDQKAIFSVTLWSIWKGRNNQVWNQVEDSPTLICLRANQLLTDWKEAQKYRLNNEIITSPPAIIRWEKPQRGRFKCNIDAAFSHNKVGFGACIRDELGNFIVARTEWFSPCTDVVIGEALGLLKAVNWAHDMGYDNMDFELDAKRVVDSVTSPRPNDSDLGAITEECNRLMALFFRNSHVKFVRRQANEVAHALARVAPFMANFHNFYDIPTCIQNIIINEMS